MMHFSLLLCNCMHSGKIPLKIKKILVLKIFKYFKSVLNTFLQEWTLYYIFKFKRNGNTCL